MCFQCMVPLSLTSTTQTYSICYSGLYELLCIMLCKYNLICGSVCTTSSLNSHIETHKPLRSKRHPTHLEFLKQIFLFGGCFQTGSSDLWRFLRGRTCLVAVATLAYGSWECSSVGHEEMKTRKCQRGFLQSGPWPRDPGSAHARLFWGQTSCI